MTVSTEEALTEIENEIRTEFPNAKIEFATQSFTTYVELWLYVLDLKEYDRVVEACRSISDEQHLDQRDPEIWLLVKTWTGPWPGGESEQEIKRRREEFRRKHGLVAAAPA